MLPQQRITGIPHHHDVLVHTLTRLSTKPVNRYRYLQVRQRALHPITPVHTYAEFKKFKNCINDTQFRKKVRKDYSPAEAYKRVDFEKLAVYWNSEVDKQDQTETDSNKRLYYKLPPQLERHHKRTLAWSSECSMVLLGSNAEALQPFRDLLAANNKEDRRALPALPLHNLNVSAFDAVNLRLPTEESQSQLIVSRGALTSVIPNPDISLPSGTKVLVPSEGVSTIQPQMQSRRTFGSSPIPSATTPQAGEDRLRCAVCAKVLCDRFCCAGSGKRELCLCGHPPLKKGERVRLSEKRIKELISRARIEREGGVVRGLGE
jgi:hypothetical protein